MNLPRNCVNCGAILHGGSCEYCGTVYGPTELTVRVDKVEPGKGELEKFAENLRKLGSIGIRSLP